MLAQKKLATNHINCASAFRWVLVAVVLLIASCSSTPTDVRTVVPGDALVYLETQDLGAALQAVTDNDAFRATAKSQPDFSALEGMKVGVAVTGFETREEKVTEETSVLNFQPRFVAVAETNAWNFQAIKFTENRLGEFVNDVYGGGVELERFPRFDGDYFIWTAQDGRKAYGLVIGSLVFFGNDDSAIEKCIAVRKGEAESIAKGGKVPTDDSLASGYVSADGVAQIANIASIQLAVGAGEEEEVRGFIARVLPEILRNSVQEVTWTASVDETAKQVRDQFSITLAPEVSNVLDESLASGEADPDLSRFVPKEFVSSTRYHLKDSQIAWRGVLLTARSRTDLVSGHILSSVSSSLFEPYAVDDAELFLSSIGNAIQTVKFDAEGEEVAGTSKIFDLEKMRRSLSEDLSLSAPPERFENSDLWRSKNGDVAVAIVDSRVIFGETKAVEKCLIARNSGQRLPEPLFDSSKAPVITIGYDSGTAARLAGIFGVASEGNAVPAEPYSTETTFSSKGVERRTISNHGMIGTFIEQFAKE